MLVWPNTPDYVKSIFVDTCDDLTYLNEGREGDAYAVLLIGPYDEEELHSLLEYWSEISILSTRDLGDFTRLWQTS